MQLLLQTASWFEEPHKEAHCKSKGMKRQINYSFLLTESSQRYRYIFTKPGFIHKYPVSSSAAIILKSTIWKSWVRKTKRCEVWWLSSLMVQAGFCIIIITQTCVIFWGYFMHMETLNRIFVPTPTSVSPYSKRLTFCNSAYIRHHHDPASLSFTEVGVHLKPLSLLFPEPLHSQSVAGVNFMWFYFPNNSHSKKWVAIRKRSTVRAL